MGWSATGVREIHYQNPTSYHLPDGGAEGVMEELTRLVAEFGVDEPGLTAEGLFERVVGRQPIAGASAGGARASGSAGGFMAAAAKAPAWQFPEAIEGIEELVQRATAGNRLELAQRVRASYQDLYRPAEWIFTE